MDPTITVKCIWSLDNLVECARIQEEKSSHVTYMCLLSVSYYGQAKEQHIFSDRPRQQLIG